MTGNHAVMEVKSARGVRDGFPKDLRTLTVFREEVGYERAIYLIYGEEVAEGPYSTKQKNERIPGDSSSGLFDKLRGSANHGGGVHFSAEIA